MIKLFLSVTLATAFMGLVACEPTSTSSTTVKGTNQATHTPTTTTESTDTVTEATDTPSTKTESTGNAKGTNEATQTTTESTDTVTGTNEASDTPIVTTESTGNVTGEGNGTVMEYTPGEFLTVKTEAGEPLRCKFGEMVTYVTSDGKVIDASKIRKDSKVRVLYHKDGDDMVVDKVIVSGVRD